MIRLSYSEEIFAQFASEVCAGGLTENSVTAIKYYTFQILQI